MDQESFYGRDQGISEDQPLSLVSSTDSTYSCCPIIATAFDYDSSLFQTSPQPQASNISNPPFLTTQPLARSWPSTIPRPFIDSTYSDFPITQHGNLTTTTFNCDPNLFQPSSPPQAVNISTTPLFDLQPLTQSWSSIFPCPIAERPTVSKDSIHHSLSTSDMANPLTKRPYLSNSIHSTATSADISTVSQPTSPHTAHSNGVPSLSDSRKSRRRAQNCAAQRAFRARKEQTIKESFIHVEILNAKVKKLEGHNGSLSDTVDDLRGEIEGLRKVCEVFEVRPRAR